MLVLQNVATTPAEFSNLELELLPNGSGTAKFDLLFNFAEGPQGLTGELEYNQDLFDNVTITRMTEHFQTLLAGAVANPDNVSPSALMTEVEQEQVVVEWNSTETKWRREADVFARDV